MSKTFLIGTRGSALALAQTRLIMDELKKAWPRLDFDLKIIKTTGDRRSESDETAPLEGKGMFTVELEEALLRGEVRLAVHSLKDLPTAIAAPLRIAAIPLRADPRDCLVTRGPISIGELPRDGKVATGSARRARQLQRKRSDLQMADIRGNIDTRLRKLRENNDWCALVLAQAGLDRLQPDLHGLIATPISVEAMAPAPGQGALALQIKAEDDESGRIAEAVHHVPTACQVTAERAFLAGVGGGCSWPLGAYAVIREERLDLAGIYWHADELLPRHGTLVGPADEPEQLGLRLAETLLRNH